MASRVFEPRLRSNASPQLPTDRMTFAAQASLRPTCSPKFPAAPTSGAAGPCGAHRQRAASSKAGSARATMSSEAVRLTRKYRLAFMMAPGMTKTVANGSWCDRSSMNIAFISLGEIPLARPAATNAPELTPTYHIQVSQRHPSQRLLQRDQRAYLLDGAKGTAPRESDPHLPVAPPVHPITPRA